MSDERAPREQRFERRMTDAEALMWNIEKDPWLNPNGGVLVVLEGPIDMDDFERRITFAAYEVPRLREHVVSTLGRWSPPIWKPDGEFDMAFHIRRLALGPPGSMRELLDLVVQLYQDPFDRSRPLWQFFVIEGLEGGRSALFWKSLPISDLSTVLSKVVAATLVAPVLAMAAIIALQLGFLVLMSLYALLHRINPFPLLWSPTHLFALWFKLVLIIPVNALWALPSVGWLLLCSSFARSKPFLWAVALPIMAGVLNSWFGLLKTMTLTSTWFWQNIVGRLLLSIIPGSWMDAETLRNTMERAGDDVRIEVGPHLDAGFTLDAIGHALVSPSMLIGIVAGVAMIAAAVYFRRVRTESYA